VGQSLLARFALLGRCIVLRSIRCRRLAIGTILGVEMTGCHSALWWYSLHHSMRYRVLARRAGAGSAACVHAGMPTFGIYKPGGLALRVVKPVVPP